MTPRLMRRFGRDADAQARVVEHQYEVPPRPIDERTLALRLCRETSCSHWSARGSVRCTRCGAAL